MPPRRGNTQPGRAHVYHGRTRRTRRTLHLLLPLLASASLAVFLLLPAAAASPSLEALLAEEKRGGTPDARKGALYTELCEAWTERTDTLATEAEAKHSKRSKHTKHTGSGATSPAAAAENAVLAGRQAVALAPKSCRAHTALAVALGKKTDYVDNATKMALSREIRLEAERALALEPEDELAHHILGRWKYSFATLNPLLRLAARAVYGTLPEASLEEARMHLEKAVALNPRRLATQHCLALIYKQNGDREQARKHWKAVLALPALDAEDRAAHREAQRELQKK